MDGNKFNELHKGVQFYKVVNRYGSYDGGRFDKGNNEEFTIWSSEGKRANKGIEFYNEIGAVQRLTYGSRVIKGYDYIFHVRIPHNAIVIEKSTSYFTSDKIYLYDLSHCSKLNIWNDKVRLLKYVEDGMISLKNIPEEHRTETICMKALERDCFEIKYFPKDLKTEEAYMYILDKEDLRLHELVPYRMIRSWNKAHIFSQGEDVIESYIERNMIHISDMTWKLHCHEKFEDWCIRILKTFPDEIFNLDENERTARMYNVVLNKRPQFFHKISPYWWTIEMIDIVVDKLDLDRGELIQIMDETHENLNEMFRREIEYGNTQSQARNFMKETREKIQLKRQF
jgi:hypothetical protein